MSSAAVNVQGLISPRGLLRVLEVISCIITFAIIADHDAVGKDLDKTNALFAAGLIGFFVALVFLFVLVLNRLLVGKAKMMNMVQLIIDALMCIFLIVTGAVFGDDVRKARDQCGRSSFCNDLLAPFEACVAFAIIAGILFFITCIFDFLESKKGEAEQAAN